MADACREAHDSFMQAFVVLQTEAIRDIATPAAAETFESGVGDDLVRPALLRGDADGGSSEAIVDAGV